MLFIKFRPEVNAISFISPIVFLVCLITPWFPALAASLLWHGLWELTHHLWRGVQGASWRRILVNCLSHSDLAISGYAKQKYSIFVVNMTGEKRPVIQTEKNLHHLVYQCQSSPCWALPACWKWLRCSQELCKYLCIQDPFLQLICNICQRLMEYTAKQETSILFNTVQKFEMNSYWPFLSRSLL